MSNTTRGTNALRMSDSLWHDLQSMISAHKRKCASAKMWTRTPSARELNSLWLSWSHRAHEQEQAQSDSRSRLHVVEQRAGSDQTQPTKTNTDVDWPWVLVWAFHFQTRISTFDHVSIIWFNRRHRSMTNQTSLLKHRIGSLQKRFGHLWRREQWVRFHHRHWRSSFACVL